MRPEFVVTARMLGWCVYVWKKSNPEDADFVMYVGCSENGVRRFASHHVLPFKYTEDDYIEIYPCTSELTARNLERKLIVELKPQLNKKVNFKKELTAISIMLRRAARREAAKRR